jgi:hypothetical protein
LLLGFGGSTERRLLEATQVLGEVLRAAHFWFRLPREAPPA